MQTHVAIVGADPEGLLLSQLLLLPKICWPIRAQEP